jgi:hypothetical protein
MKQFTPGDLVFSDHELIVTHDHDRLSFVATFVEANEILITLSSEVRIADSICSYAILVLYNQGKSLGWICTRSLKFAIDA